MNYQTIPTSKLFYKKWVYKVECRVEKAYSVKYFLGKAYRSIEANLFADALCSIKVSKDFQTRVEGNHFNIFCNDEDLLNNIVQAMSKWVFCVYAPSTPAEKHYLLNNGNRKILKNKYHKGKYQYRILLRENLDITTRKNFFSWINRYDNSKFCVSGNSLRWLSGAIRYCASPCIYAADSSAMSMICLYLGENIKYVEEFILRGGINTSSET